MSQFEICGWVGAALVLFAYYLVSSGKAKAETKLFQFTNIFGALFLIVYTYNCQAYASMIVNIIWVVIGLLSYIKILKLSKVLKH